MRQMRWKVRTELDLCLHSPEASSATAERLLVAITALGTMLAPLNSTMIAVALPDISRALGVGPGEAGGVARQTVKRITDHLARELSSFTDQQSVGSRLGWRPSSDIHEVERIGSRTEMTNKTRIAVLGTLAELHREPIRYNLACLTRLVEEINPDLLCAELPREVWERSDMSNAPVEYREALIPLAARTDIVLVPIQGAAGCEKVMAHGGRLRHTIMQRLDGLLRWFQRRADEPRAIHSGAFGHLCHTICLLEIWVGGLSARHAWDAANRALLENVLAAVRRDPGVRVLITVDCRRWHQLAERLRHVDEIELVPYWEL